MTNAAEGFTNVVFDTTYWRIKAAAPAASGVDILVPNIYTYLLLYSGYSIANEKELQEVRHETTSEPGATTSGLMRPSLAGPRAENAAIPILPFSVSALSTTQSDCNGSAENLDISLSEIHWLLKLSHV